MKQKYMFFWNSLAFSMIQQMLAIWSLVPLPFLSPAWTSGNSQFMNCWSLAWRIVNITLLGVRWVQVCVSLHKASPRALNNCPRAALLFPDCSSLSLQLCLPGLDGCLNLLFETQGRGHRQASVLRSPMGSCLVSFSLSWLPLRREEFPLFSHICKIIPLIFQWSWLL